MADPHKPVGALKALQERLGLSDEQVADAGVPDGEPYAPHAEFGGRFPRYAVPGCEGTLRVEDKAASMWALQCDACRLEVGMPAPIEHLRELRLERACIPPAFADKPFEKFPEQERPLAVCRQWIREFKPGAAALPAPAIFGGPGRGKTHLLSLIARTLVENHVADAFYVTSSDLFDELRSGVGSGEYERRWQRVLSVGVLILDDLGSGRRTPFLEDRLGALVDHRYRAEMPIVLASNLPPQTWPRAFGERTASRLKMCLPLHLEGPDRRASGDQLAMGQAA